MERPLLEPQTEHITYSSQDSLIFEYNKYDVTVLNQMQSKRVQVELEAYRILNNPKGIPARQAMARGPLHQHEGTLYNSI